MDDKRMSAGEFLRDLVGNLSRANLAVIALAVALTVAICVALGSSGLSHWFAFASAAGFVALEAGLVWCALSIPRVQQWIRNG